MDIIAVMVLCACMFGLTLIVGKSLHKRREFERKCNRVADEIWRKVAQRERESVFECEDE